MKTIDDLDRIDRQILDILQRDGRIANVTLAEQVNLSPSPCLERVRRLEQQGFIREYAAHLDPVKLGSELIVYIEVSLKSTTTEALNTFNSQMLALEEVVECAMVAGGFDYLLKIRTRDMQAYRQFLGDKLANIELVAQTHTYAVMEQVKSTHLLPIDS